MRYAAVTMILAGACFGQGLTEFGALAAAGSTSGAAGQNVGKGMSAVFGRVNEQAAKAARSDAALPVDGAWQQGSVASGVPLPPPTAAQMAATWALPSISKIAIPEQAMQMQNISDVAPNLPPPPEMSMEKLKAIQSGMSRADLLRLGAPASKISMDEDGHAVEIYSYRENGQKIGTVRLNDGSVASVQ